MIFVDIFVPNNKKLWENYYTFFVIYCRCFLPISMKSADTYTCLEKEIKKSHRSDTVAKIWIEQNGEKQIEVCWSELDSKDEAAIIKIIDERWEELNNMIDKVFAGESVEIIKIRNKG